MNSGYVILLLGPVAAILGTAVTIVLVVRRGAGKGSGCPAARSAGDRALWTFWLLLGWSPFIGWLAFLVWGLQHVLSYRDIQG